MYFRLKEPPRGSGISYSVLNKLYAKRHQQGSRKRFGNEFWFIMPKLTSFFEPSKFLCDNYRKYV